MTACAEFGVWHCVRFGLSGFIGRCLLSVLAAALAVLNVIPGWMFSLPGCVELWLARGSFEICLVFFLLHQQFVDIGDNALYGELTGDFPNLSPLFVSLCVFGGWTLFPGFSGVMLGPLALLVTLYLISAVRYLLSG